MHPCPRCNLPLGVEEHGDIVMETCDRCLGRWMDPDDLKAILDVIRLPVRGQAVRTGVDLTDVTEDALCPRCAEPMQPFNYAGDSGVILDKCPHCGGLWLDKGDLERVLAVVSASEQDLARDVKRFQRRPAPSRGSSGRPGAAGRTRSRSADGKHRRRHCRH